MLNEYRNAWNGLNNFAPPPPILCFFHVFIAVATDIESCLFLFLLSFDCTRLAPVKHTTKEN